MDLLPIPTERIPDFCRRWMVREFAFTGSIVSGDFGPDSDVDVLLTFDARAQWDLFDMVAMRDELAAMFGRAVDIIEEGAVRNPYMRASIKRTKRVHYAA